MKNIIVSGASGNLGQAVIRKFLQEGCRVIGIIIPGDPVAIGIREENFETVEVDLTDEKKVEEVTTKLINKLGKIDVAILTAGGFAAGKIAETSVMDIRNQVRLNFETAYNLARPVFTNMLKQNEGIIFLVGARTGLDMRNSKGMTAYGLSKSLVFRLAELMNEEAKGTNVVTCVVAPSTIDTPQNRESMPGADFSKWVQPGAIADVIYYYTTAPASIIREPVIKVYGNG
jgi:NADP-dependent 3-hydroxy acid dehydrogenase YdfG